MKDTKSSAIHNLTPAVSIPNERKHRYTVLFLVYSLFFLLVSFFLTRFLHDFIQNLHGALFFARVQVTVCVPRDLHFRMPQTSGDLLNVDPLVRQKRRVRVTEIVYFYVRQTGSLPECAVPLVDHDVSQRVFAAADVQVFPVRIRIDPAFPVFIQDADQRLRHLQIAQGRTVLRAGFTVFSFDFLRNAVPDVENFSIEVVPAQGIDFALPHSGVEGEGEEDVIAPLGQCVFFLCVPAGFGSEPDVLIRGIIPDFLGLVFNRRILEVPDPLEEVGGEVVHLDSVVQQGGEFLEIVLRRHGTDVLFRDAGFPLLQHRQGEPVETDRAHGREDVAFEDAAFFVERRFAEVGLDRRHIFFIQRLYRQFRRRRRFFDFFEELLFKELRLGAAVCDAVDLTGAAGVVGVVDAYAVLLFAVLFSVHFVDWHGLAPFGNGVKWWSFPQEGQSLNAL